MHINCPFHRDDTASMKLYDDGYAHCFGCNAHVHASKLPEGVQYVPDTERPKYVEDVPQTVAWIRSLPKRTVRGLDLHVTDDSYFVLWPDGSYYNRRYHDPKPGKSKYKCPSGVQRPLLFASQNASKGQLLIVEGEINALSVAEACPELNVVTPGGAGDFYSKHGQQHLPIYLKYANIILLADKDKAGAIACIELKSLLMPKNPNVSISLMEQDANEILVTYGKEKLRENVLRQVGMSL